MFLTKGYILNGLVWQLKSIAILFNPKSGFYLIILNIIKFLDMVLATVVFCLYVLLIYRHFKGWCILLSILHLCSFLVETLIKLINGNIGFLFLLFDLPHHFHSLIHFLVHLLTVTNSVLTYHRH